MTKVEERNLAAKKYVCEMMEFVSDKTLDELGLPANLIEAAEPLFLTKYCGYREVALTACVAKAIGVNFDPSTDFYGCNPRSLYPKGVRLALEEHKIPHRLDGPLNVTKGIALLDENWVAGRQDKNAARAVVDLVRRMADKEELEQISRLLHRRLLDQATLAAIEVVTPEGMTIAECTWLIVELIKRYPDAGNTPERIVRMLLDVLFTENASLALKGGEGRACTTSATSKSPSDIWVMRPIDGEEVAICFWEVTAKRIDMTRIRDSSAAINSYGLSSAEVIWLCRIPDDITELSPGHDGSVVERGVRHEFIDLFQWIESTLSLFGVEARQLLIQRISDYISDYNIAAEIKEGWQLLAESVDRQDLAARLKSSDP